MKVDVRWLVLALPVLALALIAGCGTDIPACADVSWVGYLNHAQLTGPPSFSAVQISPADPLTIAVPVNVNTRTVSVRVRSVDKTPPGSGGRAETDGDEIVEISMEDTNLPAGVYVADRINLDGDIAPQFAQYIASGLGMSYVLSVFPAAESQSSCVTDIPVATFEVVGD